MKRSRIIKAVRALLSPRFKAKEACRQFFRELRGGQGDLVRLPQAVHSLICIPTGGGKNVSFITPFLLTCNESCIVLDIKGELATLTATHRRRMGQNIILLDPYRSVTHTPDTYNCMDFIKKENALAIDECNSLANALVVRDANERERHWNDSAEGWLATILAIVVFYGEEATRSLQTVRDILSHPQKLEMAIQVACESDAWDGMLARMGGQLLHFVEKEKASVLTTVGRHLRFLDTLAVSESTKTSSFDPAELRSGRMTIYLILKPEHLRAQIALVRMWITSLLKAVIRDE